jgi:hypothetical protein
MSFYEPSNYPALNIAEKGDLDEYRKESTTIALFKKCVIHRRVEPWRSGYRVGLSVSVPFG